MGRDAIAIIPSAPVRHRNSDVEYAYRQDSDFYYLTGIDSSVKKYWRKCCYVGVP